LNIHRQLNRQPTLLNRRIVKQINQANNEEISS
jgi:hypothetical protein